MKTSSSRSSRNVVVSIVLFTFSCSWRRLVFAASVWSRRTLSIARLRAVVTSHARGVRRIPVAGPAFGGDRERILCGFLGEVEITEEADHRRDDGAPVVSKRLVENRYHSMIGRTSIAPPRRAAGICAASSMAASRSSASKIK